LKITLDFVSNLKYSLIMKTKKCKICNKQTSMPFDTCNRTKNMKTKPMNPKRQITKAKFENWLSKQKNSRKVDMADTRGCLAFCFLKEKMNYPVVSFATHGGHFENRSYFEVPKWFGDFVWSLFDRSCIKSMKCIKNRWQKYKVKYGYE